LAEGIPALCCRAALGANEAKAATGALNGVPNIIKTQLEAIKIFEKGLREGSGAGS
jgi:hypothetical protein